MSNQHQVIKIGEMGSQVIWTMKATIFPQVWHSYIFVYVISNKIMNIKVVYLNIMNTTKCTSSKKTFQNMTHEFSTSATNTYQLLIQPITRNLKQPRWIQHQTHTTSKKGKRSYLQRTKGRCPRVSHTKTQALVGLDSLKGAGRC